MNVIFRCALFGLCLAATPAHSQISVTPADCTRSATLLACRDNLGNSYSVATLGTTIYLRGYEVRDKRRWSQVSSRYGNLTFFTGLASDGEAWVGYSRKVGWTTLNRFSSSSGGAGRFTCNRLVGC
jgi:hypothetical protein